MHGKVVMLLEKMLQSQGFGSRKHCQQLIKNGAVSIQNEIQTDPKFAIQIKPDTALQFSGSLDREYPDARA